jgi:protein-disulfide isomerase
MEPAAPPTPNPLRRAGARRLVPIGLGLACLLALGGWVLLTWLRRDPPPPPPEDWKSLGSAEAAVVIREYADFQCPACQAFHARVLPELIKDYVSTGRVRFDFHHFLIFSGRESLRAAEASECAGELGQFWAYHDQLFASAPAEDQRRFSDAHLLAIAPGVGLDLPAFETCLTSSRYNQKVIDAQIQANTLHLPGTPAVFVGDAKIANPFDYAAIQAAIQAAEKRQPWWRALLP